MTDQDSFDHFKLKWYEFLTLLHKHYIPLGKNYPEYYNKPLFIMWKAWKKGDIPEFGEEPVMEEEVKQLDMFERRAPAFLSDNQAEKPLGPLFDNITSETKTDES